METRRRPRTAVACILCLWAGLSIGAGAAEATDPRDLPEIHKLGTIEIVDPWAKGTIGLHRLKLFFEFRNSGKADRLVAAHSSAAKDPGWFRLVSGSEGREISSVEAIAIPESESTFELSEVGYFIELTGLQSPAVMGKTIPVRLRFERAGEIEISFTCRFHSPKLSRRIRAAARAGDIETLRKIRGEPSDSGSEPNQ